MKTKNPEAETEAEAEAKILVGEIDVSATVARKEIVVRAYKYDRALHKSWRARVARREGALLVLDAEFAETIHHPLLGTIERGTISEEYYWLDRPYNVFRFSTAAGGLRNFYCNINQLPVFDGEALSYVDLDIDVLVAPDLSYRILDEDEFAANALRYAYPLSLQTMAKRALAELIDLIERGGFPFGEQKAATLNDE